MEPDALRQLGGGVELAADAVEAAVGAIAEVHQTIARQVYAPFALLSPLAAPAHAIEQFHCAITGQVYQAILATNAGIAHVALALLVHHADRRG